MMTVLTFCLFMPALFLCGRRLATQAAGFIRAVEGAPPPRLPGTFRLALVFALTGSWIVTRGLSQQLPDALVFRDLMLLGWGVLLCQLDVARRWLPLAHTNAFILSGLLFTLLPGAGPSSLVAAADGLGMCGLLWLFRLWVNRHGFERFGQGDVWLIAGLSVWLTLPVAAGLTLSALLIITLRHLAALAGLLPSVRDTPLAPWLFLCVCVALLTQTFPFTTG